MRIARFLTSQLTDRLLPLPGYSVADHVPDFCVNTLNITVCSPNRIACLWYFEASYWEMPLNVKGNQLVLFRYCNKVLRFSYDNDPCTLKACMLVDVRMLGGWLCFCMLFNDVYPLGYVFFSFFFS